MLKSINQLSELTGIDRRTVKTRLESVNAITGERGAYLYETREALPLLYLASGERLDPAQERAALDRVRRRQIEMANEKAEGNLIPKEEVAAAWTEQILIAKGRLLSLPSRVSSDLLRTKTQRDMEQRLRDAGIEILEELSGQREVTA